MSTENIVKGKYFRILKDKTNAIWDRISFWTHADDVELSSGATLSSDLTAKQTKIDATQTDFAQVETSSTSAHAYTKGQMLIYNNQLYRVKAAIAVGNTLTVGTNIEAVSVSTLSSMLTATSGNQFYFDYKDNKPGFYPTASKTASTFVPFGGTSLRLASNYMSGTGTTAGSHTVTGLTKDAWYVFFYYSTSSTQYSTITSGATSISRLPDPSSTGNGNNFTLFKATGTSFTYTNNANMVFVKLFRIYTE